MDLSSSSSSSSDQNQDDTPIESFSRVSPENPFKSNDDHQNLLIQNQNPIQPQTLQQIDSQFDKRYICYNRWLYLMVLASGLFAFYITGLTFNILLSDFNLKLKLSMLGVFACTILVFSQFILEICTIGLRDLATANLALVIITINSFIFVGLAGYFGYELHQFYENTRVPPEIRSSSGDIFTFCLKFTSIFSVTNIFFTNIPAVKVRNDLRKREAFRASIDLPLEK